MVQINLLTHLTFQLIALVDSGHQMTVKDVTIACQQRMILDELENRFPRETTRFNIDIFDSEIQNELHEIFGMMTSYSPASQYRIQHNGLNLMMAYAQEQIQREIHILYKNQ